MSIFDFEIKHMLS